MIAVYAEKFDVGVKLAATLGGFDYNGKHVTMKNVAQLKEELEKNIKKKGVIYTTFEGNEYGITWGQGHMCGLKQAKDYNEDYANWSKMPMPFFPENYEIKIRDGVDRATRKSTGEPDPWTVRQLDIVGDVFDKCEYIINATDDDREGETIFAYVYEILNCHKEYKRIKMDSQTEEGLLDAFRHLMTSDKVKNIEAAGRGRAIADWIVGANLSAAMSLKYGNSGGILSIGRVQTPVLNMLVERELAIQNFVSKPFWYAEAEFTTESGEKYVGKHTTAQIENKADAEALLEKIEGKPGVITEYTQSPIKKEVPYLYSLTTLSMDANDAYGFTAQETLDLAQELYMAGYTTYPRTSSQHLTDDMHDTVDEVLEMLSEYSEEYKSYIDMVPKGKRNYTKRHFDTKKVESHFAIIPTKVKPEKMTSNQQKLYDLIAKSVIRIIFKPAEGESTKITTTVEDENFKTNGTVITDPQWLVVAGSSKSKDSFLPAVSENDEVSGNYKLKEGKTNPPTRYTDKSLIAAMSTAGKTITDDDELKKILLETNDGGIGRESTRPGIIETVVSRQYAERKGDKKVKYIVPTEKGIKLISILPLDEMKSAKLTAEWEMRLSKIEKGEDDLDSFIKDMEEQTKKWVEDVEKAESAEIEKPDNLTEYVCPKCGKPMKKYSWGWACSGYKKDDENSCKFAISYTIAGVKLSDTDITDLLTKRKTKFIKGFKKKDSEETYGAFLILDDDNKLGRSWDTGLTCPMCGKPITVSKKAWGCSGWKEGCKVTVWDTISGKTLSDNDKRDLLTKKKTKLIKGFKKKDGTSFDAKLIIDDDGKVTFAPQEKK